jgi:hypothetical protein
MMINDVLIKALDDGLWGNVMMSCLNDKLASVIIPNPLEGILSTSSPVSDIISSKSSSSSSATNAVSAMDLHIMLSSMIGENQDDLWILLPFLSTLLSRIPLDLGEKIVIQLNLTFKTDECQSEAICCIDDKNWLPFLFDLAFTGIIHNRQTLFNNDFINVIWGQLPTYTDFTLDTIAVIMDYKIRYCSIGEGFYTWNNLKTLINDNCESYFSSSNSNNDKESANNILSPTKAAKRSLFAEYLNRKMMKRCTLLVFQRLSKITDDCWSIYVIDAIDSIFTTLLSNILTVKQANETDSSITAASSSTSQLLDFDTHEEDDSHPLSNLPYLVKIDEDILLVQFVIDIIESLRLTCKKASSVPSIFAGHEWTLIKKGFLIMINSFHILNESIITRMSQEIVNNIRKLSEMNAICKPYEFTKLIFDCLMGFEEVIHNPITATAIKIKCSDIVFSIISYFSDLRVGKSSHIPPHIEDLMKKLIIVEHITDIELVFSILRTAIKNETNNVISFEGGDDDTGPNSNQTSNKSSKTIHSIANDPTLLDFSSDEPIGKGEKIPVPSTSRQTTMNFDLLDDPSLLDDTSTNGRNSSVDGVQPTITQDPSPLSSTSVVIPVSTTGTTSGSTAKKIIDISFPEDEKSLHIKGFLSWLKVRQGILTDRIDSERSRLSKSMKSQDANSEATKKYWKKAKRKTESEYFLETHKCQWKLGISHEGQFYGRKRLILRPRFDFIYTDPSTKDAILNNSHDTSFGGGSGGEGTDLDMSAEEFDKLLTKEYSGYIKDVTRTDAGTVSGGFAVGDERKPGEMSEHGNTGIPGTGWGLVDADGSEDGFGVIGIVKDGNTTNPSNLDSLKLTPVDEKDQAPLTSVTGIAMSSKTVDEKDILSDLIHTEEALDSIKGVLEVGPSLSGVSRPDSSTPKLEARVVMVTASGTCWGYLQLNDDELFFRSSFGLEDARKDDNAAVNIGGREQRMRRRRWKLDCISAIYLRRYRLRDSAIEIFFRKGKHRNVFFDFGHTRDDAKLRNEFSRSLNTAAPSNAFKQTINMNTFRVVYDHGIQEKWLSGKMSNFDYLMALNTIAGRTFNDLCQYPVMPWILNDYTSEKLDLTNPAIYRDLSKPMGALNETRLKEFLDRFNSFEENVTSGIPAFMYGSHYSTMVGVVLHFLVRLQPYASLHKEMQNGHFDVPDRLFSSIPRSFAHNTTQLSEVKEITPEWFTTPDMFRNINNFDFGLTQDGELIADVELPTWAKTAEDFVKIHREALESDYVSEHLHEWIDLIFGYKQRGPDAVDAYNVFYYLTYYGAVDHYEIKDEVIRKATELQIAHFGQVPVQLFKVPHPARKVSGPNAVLPLTRPMKRSFAVNDIHHFTSPITEEEQIVFTAPSTLVYRKSQSVIISCSVLVDRVLCILDNGIIEMLKFATSEDAKTTLASAVTLSPSTHGGEKGSNKGSANNATRKASGSIPNRTEGGGGGNNTRENSRITIEDLLFVENPSDVYAYTGSNSGNNTSSSVSKGSSASINNDSTSDSSSHPPSIPSSTVNNAVTFLGANLKDGDLLIQVDKEFIHFETVPRIPIIKYNRSDRTNATGSSTSSVPDKEFNFEKLFKAKPAIISCESNSEYLSRHITLSRSCKLSFSIGAIDGSISIREMDLKTGFIKSCADYHAHKRKVISLSADSAPDYQIISSLDESGLILIWTIIPPNPSHQARSVYAISRRPQRLFRIDPSSDMHVEISWQMGVVVAVSGTVVKIFSIERNELLRTFSMKFTMESSSSSSSSASSALEMVQVGHCYFPSYGNDTFYEFTYNGNVEGIFGNKKYLPLENGGNGNGNGNGTTSEDLLAPKYITRRFVISDYGMVIVHMEAFIYVDSLLEYEDQLQIQHLLVAYTISGVRTAVITPFSPVTCLVCPDHSEIVIAGHRDGTVVFYQAQDLTILHKLQPSAYCTPIHLALPGTVGNSSSHGNGGKREGKRDSTVGTSTDKQTMKSLTKFERGTDTTAIISISVGPSRQSPAVICMTTEAGNVYIKGLPDFIKWERNRSPSALAQLAAVPLQAVKGTILQAQNWTAETAGVIAQNARSLADEALTELKKVRPYYFHRFLCLLYVVCFLL